MRYKSGSSWSVRWVSGRGLRRWKALLPQTRIGRLARSGQFFAVAVLSLAMFAPTDGWSTVTFTLPSPYVVQADVSAATVFLSYGTDQSNPRVDGDAGYHNFDFTKGAYDQSPTDRAAGRSMIFVTLRTSTPIALGAGQLLLISAFTSQSTPVIVPIAYAGSSDCVTGTTTSQNCTFPLPVTTALDNGGNGLNPTNQLLNGAAIVPTNAVNTPHTIGFYLQDICAAVSTSDVPNICDTANKFNPPTQGATHSIALKFYFYPYVPSTATTQPPEPTTNMDTGTLNFTIQTGVPTLACPANLKDAYFPGDQQIYVNLGNFGYTATGAPEGPLIVVANNGSAAPTGLTGGSLKPPSNTIFAELIQGGDGVVTGFTNTTNGSDNLYASAFFARDAAGAISTPCQIFRIQTGAIPSYLARSKCFIATATFRTGDAPVLSLLRSFRDLVLARSRVGHAFIHWYYGWSPQSAGWLLDHPMFRGPVFVALSPLIVLAWLLLHGAIAGLLAVGAIAVLIFGTRRRESV